MLSLLSQILIFLYNFVIKSNSKCCFQNFFTVMGNMFHRWKSWGSLRKARMILLSSSLTPVEPRFNLELLHSTTESYCWPKQDSLINYQSNHWIPMIKKDLVDITFLTPISTTRSRTHNNKKVFWPIQVKYVLSFSEEWVSVQLIFTSVPTL